MCPVDPHAWCDLARKVTLNPGKGKNILVHKQPTRTGKLGSKLVSKIKLTKLETLCHYLLTQPDLDRRPHVKVTLYGKEVSALLDSGATRTIVGGPGWRLLSELKIVVRETEVPSVTLANGVRVKILGSISLPIVLEGKCKVIEVLVIPEVPYALILGFDFWVQMGIVINATTNSWNFGDTPAEHVFALNARRELTGVERGQLDKLVQETLGQQSPDSIGCTNVLEHKIRTSSDPIKSRYYPVSPARQKQIDEELGKMLKEGIVEKSSSPWSSPVLLIGKKDGTFRFCVDYRKLNKVTTKDAYPIPYVTATLDRLRDAKYLSSLDIKSAFWQVPMEVESKAYTAFTVPNRGLFQFVRMPFGLTNSPATWQRLIDTVLGADLEPFVFVYLDDIIIVTQTFEKHLEVLGEVLNRVSQAGLTISAEKCEFCRAELKYLGYIVDGNGLHVDPDKVESIINIPKPSTVSEVRRFLGMVSWYRRFVPEFATLVAPLTHLLKKKTRFVWGEECNTAFERAKECLVSAPILSCPNFEIPFIVQTDASNYGLGAVLSQETEEGEKVVCYLSRSLTPSERKFSVTEKECLAVLWSVEKLRPYIEGAHFKVITDHHSLVWLNNLKDPVGRLARWAVRMQQFDFEMIHRKGKDNLVADALSRSVSVAVATTPASGKQDSWVEKMKSLVGKSPGNYPLWRIEGDRLYKKVRLEYPEVGSRDDYWRVVVPKGDRSGVLNRLHDGALAGHMGVKKTFERIRKLYYWPEMYRDIVKYVSKCVICQKTKHERKPPAGLMVSRSNVKQPWELLSIDLVGPLPRSSRGFAYVLTVVDYFTKFSLLFPLRSATAKEVVKIFEEQVLLIFGVPKWVVCDNGVQFRGKEFKGLLQSFGAQPLYTAFYHPQANPAERTNQEIKRMLRAYISENHRTWDLHLPQIGCALRTASHEVTKMTPFFAVFARDMVTKRELERVPIDGFLPSSPEENVVDRIRLRDHISKDISVRLSKAASTSAKYYNLRKRAVEYHPNELVWRENFVQSDATKYFSAKLAPKFIGPFVISRKVSPWTYELKDRVGKMVGVWHVRNLKPCIE